MSQLALTLSTGFVNAFLCAAEIEPAQSQMLLRQAGIAPDTLQEPEARVTEEQFSVLYRLLATRFDDELPNLLSHPLRGGAMKFAGFSVINAPTMAVAIHRYSRFLRLMIQDFEVILTRGDELSTIAIKEPEGGRRCKTMALEMILKVIHGLASWLVGHEIQLVRVDFAFSAPSYAAEFQNLFPGPVFFDQERTQLVLDSGLLSLRVQRNHDDLRHFLARLPRDWIFMPCKESLATHQVRDYLLRHDPGKANIEQMAKALGLSMRTLCRRLEAEGTSFQQVKDDLRRDLAIDRLTNTNDAISHIAFELGFSDVSSFHRAFRAISVTYRHFIAPFERGQA